MRVGVVTFPGSLDDGDAARAVRLAGAEPVRLWHAEADLRRRGRGRPARGVLLRRLPAGRGHRAVRPRDDRRRRGRGPRDAGAGHLQRLPGAVRVAPAARGSGPQRDPAVRLPGPAAARGADGDRLDLGLRAGGRRSSSRSRTARAATSPTRRRWTCWRARAGSCSATCRANPNGSRRDIAGISDASGRVVGLMPHPEHAVEAGYGPEHRRAHPVHLGGGRRPAGGPGVSAVSGSGGATSPEPLQVPLVDVPGLDTVQRAGETPDVEQPWAELGLRGGGVRPDPGHPRTTAHLGRAGHVLGDVVRALLVQVVQGPPAPLRRRHPRRPGQRGTTTMLAGIGENAGVVDIGDGWAVTFKAESHNHPSYVEPYQGAATGVGGIIRDIIAMGARPVAVMDSLRFGAVDHPDTARVVHGVVAGVGGYGNCIGLPNIGGEVYFDAGYQGNPLVNALCVGALRHEDLHLANATGQGNVIVLFGARTGGDGIGGVSVLASGDLRRGRGRVGPPVQAPRGPGRRPVPGEAAHRVLPGAVPRRRGRGHPGPGRGGPVLRDQRARLRRRRRDARGAGAGAAARPVAAPGGDPHERVAGADDGRRPPRPARGVPRHHRAVGGRVRRAGRGHRHRPAGDHLARRDRRRRAAAHRRPRGPRLRAALRPPRLARRPAGRPRGGPAARRRTPPACASRCCSMLRLAQPVQPRLGDRPVRPLRPGQHRHGHPRRRRHRARSTRPPAAGVALALDGNSRFAALDPFAGRPAVAVRGVPQRRGERGRADRGDRLPQRRLAGGARRDVAVRRGRPRPGRGDRRARHPRDRRQRQLLQLHRRRRPSTRRRSSGCSACWTTSTAASPRAGRRPGQALYLLGVTREELSGSAWAEVVHDHLGGLPPQVDLAAEQLLAAVMLAASRDGLVDAAHDVSDGGLVQALVEGCLRHGIGRPGVAGRAVRRGTGST